VAKAQAVLSEAELLRDVRRRLLPAEHAAVIAGAKDTDVSGKAAWSRDD
jgi:hypothetical protein